MIDVSLKARIGKTKEDVVLALEKKGAKIKKGKEEIDRVFFKENFREQDNIFKIKKEEDKTILCLKKQETADGKKVKLESLVSDEEVIAEMIEAMGYKEEFILKKKRTKYILDGLSINIDFIEGLDYFIEINKTVNSIEEEKDIRANIENLFNELQISKNEYILDSYEMLKYNTANNKK